LGQCSVARGLTAPVRSRRTGKSCSQRVVEIRRGWPNLFLVGAAKAGTTALYDELSRHPAIYMSPMKEPHFFSRIEPASRWEDFFPHVSDEDDYLAVLERATNEQLVGEASTSYLWDSQTAERIKHAVQE